MPTTVDGDAALEDLLADAAADVPALPPLGGPTDDGKPRAAAVAPKTSLHFKTDLSKSARDTHPSGVLHFAKLSPTALGVPREEHAFAWIARRDLPGHLDAVMGRMEGFGFTEATFIPYSSRRAWAERYPVAFPHVHCGEGGVPTGCPYYGGGGGGGDVRAALQMAAAVPGGVPVGVPDAAMTGAAGRGRKKKKISLGAHLANDERDELHVEMHRYLTWLRSTLTGSSDAAAEGRKAGIDVAALDGALQGLEGAFRVVRNSKLATEDLNEAASRRAAAMGGTAAPSGDDDPLPFLEEALTVPLGRLAEAARKDPKKRVARTRRGPGLDFEALYDRLLRYRQVHGHCNVPQKYAEDGQLGSWVANIRSKRKAMAKRGEEFELDAPADGADDDVEALDPVVEDLGGLGDGGADGPKRRRHRGGRQRLTRERIHRLDSIGFQWSVASTGTKSWEERYEDLRAYQRTHGTTRVPRSSGTLGEWVHMQRRLYNRKDPNFLAKKAQMLEDIGFEWSPRKHALVSWEDNFNRLVEFGRINRHYNVQSPFPEGYAGEYEGEDGELVEAHRFHKWVRRIHTEYRAYAAGKGSRMLNDARVMQLREIGFQFA
ncbi:hypothetical protein ACHAXT_009044 [Thalassiosira profunda]